MYIINFYHKSFILLPFLMATFALLTLPISMFCRRTRIRIPAFWIRITQTTMIVFFVFIYLKKRKERGLSFWASPCLHAAIFSQKVNYLSDFAIFQTSAVDSNMVHSFIDFKGDIIKVSSMKYWKNGQNNSLKHINIHNNTALMEGWIKNKIFFLRFFFFYFFQKRTLFEIF